MSGDFALLEYIPIVMFMGVALVLTSALLLVSYIIVQQRPDSSKNSQYECGFEPFSDPRGRFNIRFYVVAILFIIFDLEIIFLFPWVASFANLSDVAFWSMMIFLLILTVGFIYEWKKGALEWD